MGTSSYMRSVFERKFVMRRVRVCKEIMQCMESSFYGLTQTVIYYGLL